MGQYQKVHICSWNVRRKTDNGAKEVLAKNIPKFMIKNHKYIQVAQRIPSMINSKISISRQIDLVGASKILQ